MTEELKQLREALHKIKYEAVSLADAQVIALEALTQPAKAGEAVAKDRLPVAGYSNARGEEEALVYLKDALALTASQEQAAQAWDEGYHQGVADERTSEANIGVAGFGAKVEPARQNPYRTTSSTRQEQADAVMAHVHDLYAELGLKWGDNPFLAISRLKDNRASQEQAQQPSIVRVCINVQGGDTHTAQGEWMGEDIGYLVRVPREWQVQQPSGGEVSNERDCPHCNYTGTLHCGDVADKLKAGACDPKDCSHAKIYGLRPTPKQQPRGGEVVGHVLYDDQFGCKAGQLTVDLPIGTPLCVATKPEPMTDDHVWHSDGIMSANGIAGFKMDALMRIVRAVEAHHGITSTSTKGPQQ